MNASQLLAAGFAKARLHRLDSDGLAAGITGTLANGASAASYEILGPRVADVGLPDSEVTDVTGGNRLMGAFRWPIGSTPRGTLEAAVIDLDLNVALEGLKKRTLGGTEMQILGAAESDPKDICMWFMSDAYSKTSGYQGLTKKFGLMMPKGSATFKGVSPTQRQEMLAKFDLLIQTADVYPWGEALSLTNEGATEGLMALFTSDYWLDLVAFKGDGTTDTVTLTYTPAGDHTASPQRILVYVDGELATPATAWQVDTSTKVLTFQSGYLPTAGQMVEIWYEHL